ncbi:DUF1080 domain-containing protein [Alteromonas sp. KUL49]|uniref:3-keto-disaccharide hydrolase n=1 Tax=Alteromonas sp. KUL49 TaxID=2480798 RepID=UPI00102EFF84|nr:DUF1080 domain-containing protein [Alteromonas sp. KUL49]TAP42271.1 DUF1080 domain-containing protein [Alteromonas sp. KUL49]GEA09868.1 hypothetical protein KUL49_02430 [Alteromonas sp. KUL49]
MSNRLWLILVVAGFFNEVQAAENTEHLFEPTLSQFENIYDHGSAEFEDGVVYLQSTKNWFFTTKKRYKDFVLTLDVKMPDVEEFSNSGVIFRGQIVDDLDVSYVIGYQAEVDPSDRRWTGGLFDQGRRKWLYPLHPERSHRDDDFKTSFLPPWGDSQGTAYKHLEWNQIRIECLGADIKIYVNGVLTTHVRDTRDSEGVIGIQHHGSKQLVTSGVTDNIVMFRNLTITEW